MTLKNYIVEIVSEIVSEKSGVYLYLYWILLLFYILLIILSIYILYLFFNPSNLY